MRLYMSGWCTGTLIHEFMWLLWKTMLLLLIEQMKQVLLATSAKIVEFIESEWVIEIDNLGAQSICDSEFVSMATI